MPALTAVSLNLYSQTSLPNVKYAFSKLEIPSAPPRWEEDMGATVMARPVTTHATSLTATSSIGAWSN
jgi:hypothetical protein